MRYRIVLAGGSRLDVAVDRLSVEGEVDRLRVNGYRGQGMAETLSVICPPGSWLAVASEDAIANEEE